ncbi:hypothetical protein HYZ05_00935 [Candidatus Daviesbacteria bacterium]|nr:hypothetical protein [Candidatus Daviesbacteria bacterium]
MSTTQQHLSIKDIREDILILKGGGGALVLQVGAVNFGLLSQREQMAIIGSFAQMLNSLSFSIQIVIHSQRLNINSYLTLLDKAQKIQTNLLLSKMIVSYRQFIQTTIKENDVLDKKFYVVIPLFSLELGLTASTESLQQKIKTVLLPRRDQVLRQLSRVGLKTSQLTGQELLELFYSIYNGQSFQSSQPLSISGRQMEVTLKEPQKIVVQPDLKSALPEQKLNQPPVPPLTTQYSRNHPFVVEELGTEV